MNIKTLALILIVILPLALNAQYDDYYDDYYYEDYAYEVVATQYEVITNAQGKCGLATIADKKLVIPYLYKSIEIKETPIGNEEIYFVVTNDADLSGVYSLKAKKEIVPIKYSAIEFYYYDFFPNDDENPKTFCVFIASTFPQDEIPKDYYAQNGQFLLSTQHEIEWSLNSGTDVLTGIMFTKDNYSDKQGYIIFERTTGKVLQNRKCELFGYGWFDQYIVKENNKYGVLNILTNKYLINPDCDSISDIPQYIVYKNGQVAYINTSGKTIFPFGTYNKIGFEGSIEVDDEYLTAISVSNNNKWGCVDTLKKVIIPIMYDYEFEFSDTMWVSNNGKWGAIDRFNNTVVEFQYDEAKPDYFEDFDLDDPISFEYYSISKDKKWGCIMNNGAILLPVEFDRSVFYNDTMWVSKGGKWGCIDRNRNQIVDFKLDTAIYKEFTFNNKGILCKKNGVELQLDRNGNEFVKKGLTEAVRSNDEEAFKAAIATANAYSKSDALYYAIYEYNVKMFRLLMANQPELQQVTDNKPPIYHVCMKATSGNKAQLQICFEMLNTLISKGADPNQRGFSGETPLMAYFNGNYHPQIDFVRNLLNAGANVNLKNDYGDDVFDSLKSSSTSDEIKDLLKQYKKN